MPFCQPLPAPGNAVRTRAGRCDETVVRLLLDAGADPNQANRGGSTALMLAVQQGLDGQPAHPPEVRSLPPLLFASSLFYLFPLCGRVFDPPPFLVFTGHLFPLL